MSLKFSNKAKTLLSLEKHLTKSKVLPQISFTVLEFLSAPDDVLAKVLERFKEPYRWYILRVRIFQLNPVNCRLFAQNL